MALSALKGVHLATASGYSCSQLAIVLDKVGLSEEGKKAILTNDVTGEIFVELDENDIKDLFQEFKDRFLVRKILTKYHQDTCDMVDDPAMSTEDARQQPPTSDAALPVESFSSGVPLNLGYLWLAASPSETETTAAKGSVSFDADERHLVQAMKLEPDESRKARATPRTSSAAAPSAASGSSNDERFSADELLQKKPRMGAPSLATHQFLTVMREVAYEVGLWDRAPDMRAMTQLERDQFLQGVYTRLPCLQGYAQDIMNRLAQALQNRRKYLRDVVSGKRRLRMLQQSFKKQVLKQKRARAAGLLARPSLVVHDTFEESDSSGEEKA